ERVVERFRETDRTAGKIKGPAHTAGPAIRRSMRPFGLVNVRERQILIHVVSDVAPIVFDNGVENLIDELAVLQERSPQQTLLHGSDLQQRAVPSSVLHSSARFEAVHA